ncbi:hypothetical protein [Belnapia moabensis]|uniref:hypothetical protein n=1 Tax=Belnapia moabensis TaxID=365533 RepID=UPI0009FDC227|nr:hypothetical protein [Belnapia moabensis]
MSFLIFLRRKRPPAAVMGARLRAQLATDRIALLGDDIAERIQDACLKEIRKLARNGHVRVKVGTSPTLQIREIDIDLTPGR